MERDSDIEYDSNVYNYTSQMYFVGPLNIDRTTRQASTIMRVDITLGENDFEALDMLASGEGEYFTFEQLYEAAWGNYETTKSIDYATAALDSLVLQINNVGNNFMWIEHTRDKGYIFKTKWGRKWDKHYDTSGYSPIKIKTFTVTPKSTKASVSTQTHADKETTEKTQETASEQEQKSTQSHISTQAKPSMKRRFKPSAKTLLKGAGAIAAVIILMLILLYSTGVLSPQAVEPYYIEVDDPNIPLTPEIEE